MGKTLWGEYRIPVVVLAGEAGSGKTLWGLTADPNTILYNDNMETPPTTLVIDTEGSSESYSDMLNFKRIDLVETCVRLHTALYKPEHMFLEFEKIVKALQPGKYTVAMVDVITEIEDGMVEYILANPGKYGKTAAQFAKAGGLMWGVMKAEEKRILMALASKVETLVITVHMKQPFKGGKPCGKRIPKGKEVLKDIASLYMILERKADARSKEPPMVPSGRCNPPEGKSRIMGIVNGKPHQMLPPYLKDASPNGIREYLSSPPDFGNLKLSERAKPEIEMTSDERLAINAGIAEDLSMKAQSELAMKELEKETRWEVVAIDDPSSAEDIKKRFLKVVNVTTAKEILKRDYEVEKFADLSKDQLVILSRHIELLKN